MNQETEHKRSTPGKTDPLPPPPPHLTLRRWLIASLLILLPSVILAGAWRLAGVSALEDDLLYYYPIRQFIGQCLFEGHIPFWNPYAQMGMSLAADPQSGLWYPPTWLFVILPAYWAYLLTLILHFALAGWGMYRFLRLMRLEWRAALLGAIAFEFCGYLIAHRAHLTIHQSVAWLPWLLYAWRCFAISGQIRHFGLAGMIFALLMLVQHTQIALLIVILLSAYVFFVLWPMRRSLWWLYPAGMLLGGMIAAVQIVPSTYLFLQSGRGAASYALFVENSWLPFYAIMLLFPMFFGNRTPNVWPDPWWGLSHYCEQAAYGSILILLLAAASSFLLFKKRSDPATPPLRREAIFWWSASGVALLLALGGLTPLSKLLFYIPVYRSLRVPARWILIWSVAMPVLAAMTASILMQSGAFAERTRHAIRRTTTVILPVLAALCLALVLLAYWRLEDLEAAYGQRYGMGWFLEGLRQSVRWTNPAILWPLGIMLATAGGVLHWLRRPTGNRFWILFAVMVVDLAAVAAFIDVDVENGYSRAEWLQPPPLVEAIRELDPQPGQRLLVPRQWADYELPREVLWPQTNVPYRIAVLNAYGPFWPLENRLLFRFMPWGASEDMLGLLRQPALLQMMGVRFLAVRSISERSLLRAAMAPAIPDPLFAAIPDTDEMRPVEKHHDLLWPVSIQEPGIYELRFQAESIPGAAGEWYVRLETLQGAEIGWTRKFEPADLAGGQRWIRILFEVSEPMGPARVRIKSSMGTQLRVGQGRFARVAEPPGEDSSRQASTGPYRHYADLAGGVSLYELPGAVPLLRLATTIETVNSLAEAVNRLQAAQIADPGLALLEWPENTPIPQAHPGQVKDRPSGPSEVHADVVTEEGGLLVFNMSFAPGWSAWINDQPITIHRVNGVCQGIFVPPGSVQVRFSYIPRGFHAGSGLSLAGIAVLTFCLLIGRGRGRSTAI